MDSGIDSESENPNKFGDSPGKRAVRSQWNTPFLYYLHKKYGIRYRYMGLPGTELLDIKQWKDMIEDVVAFELEDASGDDSRASITKLRRGLELLGIPNQVYVGAMEEVVVLGSDLDGTDYRQQGVVTLYNLDFCNTINSPIQTSQEGVEVSRFEAIKKILIQQRECYDQNGGPAVFVLMITVRDQIRAEDWREFSASDPSTNTNKFIQVCSETTAMRKAGTAVGTHSWALKAFIFETIRDYMKGPSLMAYFFPMVKYIGKTTRSPMLHWMAVCRFDDSTKRLPDIYPKEFLSSAVSLRASEETTIEWEACPGESEQKFVKPVPENLFTKYEDKLLRGIPRAHAAVLSPEH